MQQIQDLVANLSSSNSGDTPPAYKANAISSDTIQLEILKLLKDLRSNIKRSSQEPKPDPKPGPNLKTLDDATKKH